MPLSIFTDEINRQSPERAIKMAKEWGLTHVEVRSLSPGRFPRVSAQNFEAFHQLITDAGLAVSGVSPGFFKGQPDDPTIAADLAETLPRACEWAQRLGVDQISSFAFSRGEQATPPAIVIDLVGQMADIVHQNGCQLILENEAACWGGTGTEAAEIIRAIGSDKIGLCWDPGNSARAGSTCPFPDEYEKIKDLISHVHMKNYNPETGAWDLIDRGIGDWPGQIAALAQDGYEGYLVIETHTDISPDEFSVRDETVSGLEHNSLHNLQLVRSYLNRSTEA
jgi:L-ribulose-5-phosphate 3-epimerase